MRLTGRGGRSQSPSAWRRVGEEGSGRRLSGDGGGGYGVYDSEAEEADLVTDRRMARLIGTGGMRDR